MLQLFQCDDTRKHQFSHVYVLWGQKNSGTLKHVLITSIFLKSDSFYIFVYHVFRVKAEDVMRENGKGWSFWMVRLRWSSVPPLSVNQFGFIGEDLLQQSQRAKRHMPTT